MFAPLVAAGAGTATMFLLDRPMLVVDVPAYRAPTIGHILIGTLIAVGTAAFFLMGVPAFHRMHALFHALPNPVLAIGLGGAVLGALGAVGGPQHSSRMPRTWGGSPRAPPTSRWAASRSTR